MLRTRVFLVYIDTECTALYIPARSCSTLLWLDHYPCLALHCLTLPFPYLPGSADHDRFCRYCLALPGTDWPFLALSGPARPCQIIFDLVRSCLTLPGPVLSCLVLPGPALSGTVRPCSAHLFPVLPIPAHFCPALSHSARPGPGRHCPALSGLILWCSNCIYYDLFDYHLQIT